MVQTLVKVREAKTVDTANVYLIAPYFEVVRDPVARVVSDKPLSLEIEITS
jgi:hypothetical protein